MGLAASQARLLSITSRISDNELRAQLINNQKMRLSSESSQVSENYINALNKTKLMFANYDADDNAQSVPLTFNNLTAFNQYNNQYGLTNTAGNVLISEQEAKYYQAAVGADDPQAEFLKQHGIEYTTSYWDTIADQLGDTELQYSAAQLKNMYEGYTDAAGNEIPSYADTINTKEYTDFAKYADDFEMAIAELTQGEAEREALQNQFVNAVLSGTTYNTGSLGNSGTVDSIINSLKDNFDNIDETAARTTLTSELTMDKFKAAYPNLTEINGNYYTLEASGVSYSANSMVIDSEGTTLTITGTSGSVKDTEDPENPSGVTISGDNHSTTNRELTIRYTDEEDGSTEDVNYLFDISGSTADVYIKLDANELNEYVTEFVQDTVMNVINTQLGNGATIKTTGPAASATDPNTGEPLFTTEDLELLSQGVNVTGLGDVVGNLAEVLFGDKATNYIASYTTNADGARVYSPTADEAYRLLAILNYLTSGTVQWQSNGTQDVGKDILGNDVSFNWADLALSENVFNAYVVDTMMDIFGEPVYGYLYTDGAGNVQAKHGNVDASAEAEWYINLFNKIQSSGYQVLANGLASSTEWLQFALENGIVVMEQINGEGDWQGITYTSCSDISEQTDSTAATIAEAEYNQAMRQIEAKDEMYDIELKNIDTEHTSLQTEYESVKKAMSGNIERNFQMYS